MRLQEKLGTDLSFCYRYVQDILDKVSEDEDTVLIDSEGRWHTANDKYSSEDYVGSKRDASVPAAINGTASTDSDQPLTRLLESPGSKLKREASTPGLAQAPSASTSRGKPPAQVFEIDDDDDEIVADSSSVIAASENQQAGDSFDTPLQRLPSTSALPSNGASSDQVPPSIARALAGRLKDLHNNGAQRSGSSSSSRQSPATPAQPLARVEGSTHDVIDLTLSDSDEEGSSRPRIPVRRDTSSGNNASAMNRPASLERLANRSINSGYITNMPQSASTPRFGFPSAPGSNSANGNHNGIANGHQAGSYDIPSDRVFAPLPNGRHTSDVLPNKTSAPLITPPIPTNRRSSSSNDQQNSTNGASKGSTDRDEDEDEEDEDGMPLIRHRSKKKQKRDLRLADDEDDNAPARPSNRTRKSNTDNSDELQEDERAGLALGSSR